MVKHREVLRTAARWLLILTVLTTPILLLGQTPTTSGQRINFQGRLTDDNGDPVNGPVDLVFKIYSTSDRTATAIWGEVVSNVRVDQGVFSVQLGEGQGLNTQMVSSAINVQGDATQPVFNGSNRFIGFGIVNQTEIARVQIVSVPLAINAARLDGEPAASYRDASKLTGGPIDGSVVKIKNFDASQVTTINASKISTGTISNNLFGNNSIEASKISVLGSQPGSTLDLQTKLSQLESRIQKLQSDVAQLPKGVVMATGTVEPSEITLVTIGGVQVQAFKMDIKTTPEFAPIKAVLASSVAKPLYFASIANTFIGPAPAIDDLATFIDASGILYAVQHRQGIAHVIQAKVNWLAIVVQ